MSRTALICLGLGVLAGFGWWLLGGPAVMASYFAAWLFWIGVPMGALALVMGFEAAGGLGSPLLPPLRRMLPLLPLGTVFALPLRGSVRELFARSGAADALPSWWTAAGTLTLRDGVILMVLSLLALLFWFRPRRPRRRLSTLGLLVLLFLGSVVAVDWVLAPQPALGSSLAGLLLIAGQVALAGAVAGFVLAVGTRARERLPQDAGLLVALLVAGWAFLQFAQFLVVWSANLPEEAGWYLARLSGIGIPVVAFAAVVAVLAVVLLPMVGRVPAAMASIAFTVALALLLVSLWFVLPAYRGGFAPTLTDVLAVIGLGGLLLGVMLLGTRRSKHARA